jgi:Ni,Fe-hydrogenase III small subunit
VAATSIRWEPAFEGDQRSLTRGRGGVPTQSALAVSPVADAGPGASSRVGPAVLVVIPVSCVVPGAVPSPVEVSGGVDLADGGRSSVQEARTVTATSTAARARRFG